MEGERVGLAVRGEITRILGVVGRRYVSGGV